MKHQLKTKIAVIGGGISGLATAYFLHNAGHSVTVIEKNAQVGGAIRSEQKNDFLVEHGPNSTLETTPLLREMFAGLGIIDQMIYANENAQNRYIVRNGVPVALPMSPLAFIKTKLFSGSAKLRLLKEPFISRAPADAEESLAQFVVRRIGQEFLDYAINPFVAGVYAGKPERLSVKTAFPKLYELEQKYGSLIKGTILGAKERRKRAETSKAKARLLTFQNGLQTMTDAIGEKLADSVFTDAGITSIQRNEAGYEIKFSANEQTVQLNSDALVLAIPAHAYARLPLEIPPSVKTAVARINYPSVAMVFFGYHKQPESIPLDGFGMLVPEKEHKQILGTIWSSVIFPERAPRGGVGLTTFVGGSRQPEVALLPDEKLIDVVREDIKQLMKISAKPDFVRIKRWKKAIPQYEIGHAAIVAEVEQWTSQTPGLFVTGNFRGGISVADCVKNAYELCETMNGILTQNSEKLIQAV